MSKIAGEINAVMMRSTRQSKMKMKKVKVEAYLSEYELRWLNIEAGNKPAPHWIRIPTEDKEIEVPDDH